MGTSLVVQRLRLHAPKARGLSSIPCQGSRSHMLQLKKQTNRSKHVTQQESQAPCRHEAPRILGPREKDRGCQDQEHVKQRGTSPHCSLCFRQDIARASLGSRLPGVCLASRSGRVKRRQAQQVGWGSCPECLLDPHHHHTGQLCPTHPGSASTSKPRLV